MFSCWSEPRSWSRSHLSIQLVHTLCQAGSTWLPQKVTTRLLKWYIIWHKSYQQYVTSTNSNTFYLSEFLQALRFFPLQLIHGFWPFTTPQNWSLSSPFQNEVTKTMVSGAILSLSQSLLPLSSRKKLLFILTGIK